MKWLTPQSSSLPPQRSLACRHSRSFVQFWTSGGAPAPASGLPHEKREQAPQTRPARSYCGGPSLASPLSGRQIPDENLRRGRSVCYRHHRLDRGPRRRIGNFRSDRRISWSCVRRCGDHGWNCLDVSVQSQMSSLFRQGTVSGWRSVFAAMISRLASTALRFPLILRFRRRDGLPLHVRGCVRTSAGERDNVVLHIAGACAVCPAGRWARVR